VKENDNEKQLIDSLIEPNVAVNIDKPVELSSKKAQRFSGILYTLLASFLFTISMFISKQLKVELLNALIPRFLFQSIILIIYMKFIKHYSLYKQSTKEGIFVLFIYVLFATTGFYAFFYAYRYLPLPDLITIRYTQVIWTAIIATILYREKPTISIILAVLLTIIGVTFVAQPQFLFEKTSNITTTKISTDYHQHLIGLSIAFYSAIGISIMLITNKYLLSKYKTKQSSLMLHFSFASLLMLLIHLFFKYYFINDKIQSLKNDFLNWKYLCAASICLLQIVAAILIQKAIKREHPSIFTIVQSSDILFSILLQNLFSSEKSNFLSILGSILVLTSIVIISGFKFINEKKKNTVKM
jgi:drug/metabolite transporter (DMT)-like permease